jgi:hypothetical protein
MRSGKRPGGLRLAEFELRHHELELRGDKERFHPEKSQKC